MFSDSAYDKVATQTTSPQEDPGAAVLTRTAQFARFAPSIHNTQPWAWTVESGRLLLRADRERRLTATDPQARMLTISCGASLYYARLAIAAQGWEAVVSRYPDHGDPDLLASITLGRRISIATAARQRWRTALRRSTDRRRLDDQPVDSAVLDELGLAAETESAHLHFPSPEAMIELAVIAQHAREFDTADPARRWEKSKWVGGDDPRGDGIPDAAIPQEGHELVSPRFTSVGDADSGHDEGGTDRAASFAVLFTDEDTPMAWLRGGEALGNVWITATDADLAVMPLSTVTELAEPRSLLTRLLSGLGEPLLMLRVGYPASRDVPPPISPRLPAP